MTSTLRSNSNLFGTVGGAPGRPDDDDGVGAVAGRVGEEALVDVGDGRDGAVVRQVLLHPVALKLRVAVVVPLCLYVDLKYANKFATSCYFTSHPACKPCSRQPRNKWNMKWLSPNG